MHKEIDLKEVLARLAADREVLELCDANAKAQSYQRLLQRAFMGRRVSVFLVDCSLKEGTLMSATTEAALIKAEDGVVTRVKSSEVESVYVKVF
jgi:hypothetical protein